MKACISFSSFPSLLFMAAMGPDRAVALRRLYHDMFLGPILDEMSTSGSRGGTSKTTTTASTSSISPKTTMKTTSATTTMPESNREEAMAKCVVDGVAYQDLETVGDRHVGAQRFFSKNFALPTRGPLIQTVCIPLCLCLLCCIEFK